MLWDSCCGGSILSDKLNKRGLLFSFCVLIKHLHWQHWKMDIFISSSFSVNGGSLSFTLRHVVFSHVSSHQEVDTHLNKYYTNDRWTSLLWSRHFYPAYMQHLSCFFGDTVVWMSASHTALSPGITLWRPNKSGLSFSWQVKKKTKKKKRFQHNKSCFKTSHSNCPCCLIIDFSCIVPSSSSLRVLCKVNICCNS